MIMPLHWRGLILKQETRPMKITYYCKHCGSEDVWVEGSKHMNEPDTFSEYDNYYCAGECDGEEISSVGIRQGETA